MPRPGLPAKHRPSKELPATAATVIVDTYETLRRTGTTSLLLKHAVASSKVSILAAMASFGVFAIHGIHTFLLIWLAAVVSISLVRVVLLGRVLGGEPSDIDPRCLRVHYWSGLISACSWGALAFMPVEHLPTHMQALTWGVPILVAATAMSTYSIVIHHYRDYLLLLTLCVLGGIFLHHGFDALSGTLAYALFGPVIYATGRRYHSNLMETLAARDKAQRMLDEMRELNAELNEKNNLICQEEAIATHVFAALTRHSEQNVPGVHTWNRAMGSLSGDLIQMAEGPAGQTYIFLGDFTGHGLPAALGAVPASTIFTAMAEKGLSVPVIAAELNTKLHELLPTGYFCCAVLLELSADRTRLQAWNGGLPPLVIREGGSVHIVQIPAKNLPLGVVDGRHFTQVCTDWELRPGDEIYVYSDGLTEAESISGEMWGRQRFVDFLAREDIEPPRLESLKRHLIEFTRQAPPSDDISIIEIEAGQKADSRNVA